MAELLHAMNQPLTALQCSLELSASLPRNVREYGQTIQSALEQTERLRLIVEALREISDSKARLRLAEPMPLSVVLREVMEDLLPVAESRRIEVQILGTLDFSIIGDRRLLTMGLFRLLEALIGLTEEGTKLKILGIEEPGAGCLALSWTPAPSQGEQLLSRLRLGSMVARHGLHQAGASVSEKKQNGCHSSILRFELSANDVEVK